MTDGLFDEGLMRETQCDATFRFGKTVVRCDREQGHAENGEGTRHKAVRKRGSEMVAVVWGTEKLE